VIAAGQNAPTGTAPTTGATVAPTAAAKLDPAATVAAKVDPAATKAAKVDPATAAAKVEPTASPKPAHAAMPKVDPGATSATGTPANPGVDRGAGVSSGGSGSDVPIAQVDATQSRATPGAPSTAAPTATVLSHQNLQNLNATLTTMSRQGLTQARLNLTPDSLGGVKVVLTQTDNGLVARVIADHPEAAQSLAASAGELRRSLEANGTTLVSLEFGTGDGPGAGDTGNQNGAAPYTSPSAAGAANGYGTLGDPIDDETTQTRQLTVALGDGSLVNVLA
jgi:flagellar hook-length control protein FliK